MKKGTKEAKDKGDNEDNGDKGGKGDKGNNGDEEREGDKESVEDIVHKASWQALTQANGHFNFNFHCISTSSRARQFQNHDLL